MDSVVFALYRRLHSVQFNPLADGVVGGLGGRGRDMVDESVEFKLGDCISSVQFSRLNDWVVGGIWGILFQSFLQEAIVSSSGVGRDVHSWCCPSSISSADHGVAHPQRCPEEWFWRGYRSGSHARTMQVSVSWQLPKEIHVDPLGRWSCSAPSRWFCAPSCSSEKFPQVLGFENLDPFFKASKQGPCFSAIEDFFLVGVLSPVNHCGLYQGWGKLS